MVRETVGKSVGETARKAVDAGREALRGAGDDLGSMASQARQAAMDVKDSAMEEVGARAEAGKDRLAEEGQRLAERLRSRAEDDDEPVRRRLLDIFAGGVSELSEDLRDHSLSSIFAETERFARRNPGAFIAGAAVLGFAVARFARAGSPTDAMYADRSGSDTDRFPTTGGNARSDDLARTDFGREGGPV